MVVILKDDLQAHIDKLANELGCVVVQQPGMAGMMFVEEEPPRIEGPTIDSQENFGARYPTEESCYLVMLHELGHVARGHTQGRPPFTNKTFYFDNGVLKSEAEAWEYALDNTIVEPGAVERRFMWNTCLGSYFRGAYIDKAKRKLRIHQLWNGNRHHVKFAWDDADDYFYSIKKRIEGGE